MTTQHLAQAGAVALAAALLLLAAPASAATPSPAAYTCEEQTGPDGAIAFLCYSSHYGRTCIVWVAGTNTFCL